MFSLFLNVACFVVGVYFGVLVMALLTANKGGGQ